MKIKRRNKLQKFWLRLRIAYLVLFKYKHFVIIHINRDQYANLIINNSIGEKVIYSYAGLMEFHANQVIKLTAVKISDTEIICDKALFEIEAEEIINKNKKL